MLLKQHQQQTVEDFVEGKGLTMPSHSFAISPEKVDEIRASIQSHAAIDSGFRTELIRNPKATVAAFLRQGSEPSEELKMGLSVVVLEQPSEALFVVVPSSDKASGTNSELAKLSLAASANPNLRLSLLSSPAQTLEDFLRGSGEVTSALPQGKEVKVFLEEAGELILVVPRAEAPTSQLIGREELVTLRATDPHMSSCHTCEAHTAANCHTQANCATAPCHTWSTKCC